MDKETAEQIISHMQAALDLDPDDVAIKKTNAARMLYCIGGIEARIARGEFPTLKRLRDKFGIKGPNDDTGSNGSDA